MALVNFIKKFVFNKFLNLFFGPDQSACRDSVYHLFQWRKKRKLTELISCRVIYFVCLISKRVLLTFQKASTIIIAILRIFPHSLKKTLCRRFALIWNFLLLSFKFRIKNHFSMMIWLIKKPTPFIKGIEKAWHYETTTFYFISMMVFPQFYTHNKKCNHRRTIN